MHNMAGGDGGARPPSLVNWVDFDTGHRLAKEQGKLMVVDFYVSENCGRCEIMDRSVYSVQRVADVLNADFVPVRVHLDRGKLPEGAKAIGKRYDFNYDCLLVVCDADGNAVRDDVSGRLCFADDVDPDWFLAYLNKAKGGS